MQQTSETDSTPGAPAAAVVVPPRARILVAEDDETNREMLARFLSKKDYDVVSVGDGGEALDVLNRMPVDLVLLDWMMPQVSGIDALRTLRDRSNIPVIMLTSVARSEDVIRALEVGADDYVTKPYDLGVLAARIEAQLRRARSATVSPDEGTVDGVDASFARRYEIHEQIGEGSFGVIYRGRHKELGMDIAVKILRNRSATDPAAIEEVRTEGVRACLVRHENALRVFDFGVFADGRPYLVMELLRGRTLADVVKRGGPVSVARAVEVLLPVARCLAAAHAQKIVHRDIKLANIFLHETALDGTHTTEVVKVLDFGIAKLLDDGSVTTRDGIAGSPAYMAPERLCGLRYDGRADVYSLGICLYELVTGLAPFRSPTGDSLSVGLLHLRKRAVPPSRIVPMPSLVDDVVAELLVKDPLHRPTAARAVELLQSLQSAR